MLALTIRRIVRAYGFGLYLKIRCTFFSLEREASGFTIDHIPKSQTTELLTKSLGEARGRTSSLTALADSAVEAGQMRPAMDFDRKWSL